MKNLYDRTNAATFILFLLLTIFTLLFVIYIDYKTSKPKVVKIPSNVVNYEPDWLRIKRRCGIPDSIPWSNNTRLIYGKQIEVTIKSMN